MTSQIQTDWVQFTNGEHGQTYRIRVQYGFDLGFSKRYNQDPYFSMTGDIEVLRHDRWREDSCGSIHDQIAVHFPHLAPLVKWHLVSTVEPMHYMANALFWHDEAKRLGGWDVIDTKNCQRNTSLDNLKKTIVYGGREFDLKVNPASKTRAQLAQWLKQRLPGLMNNFRRDMASAGINFPE